MPATSKNDTASRSTRQSHKWITGLVHPIDVSRLAPPKKTDEKKSLIRSSAAKIKGAYSNGTANRLHRWSKSRIAKHTSWKDTYFYTSDSSNTAGLICIDVDGDDPEESLAFCHYLKKTFWRELYYEPSTGGEGAHAYIVIHWDLIPRAEVMRRLRKFERWLDATADSEGFGVKQVEIAGTPTEILWGAELGQIDKIQFGQPAKLPRSMKRAESTITATLRDIDRVVRDNPFDVEAPPKPAMESESEDSKPKKKRGSVRGIFITRAMIEDQMATAQDIIDDYRPVAKGNSRNITVEHVAAFLSLALFFSENPNADGSNPTARMKSLWRACQADGTIKVAYVPAIIAAVRNALSDAGLIDWLSNKYQPGPMLQIHRPDQERVKGFAMKWSLPESNLANYRAITELVRAAVDSPPVAFPSSIAMKKSDGRAPYLSSISSSGINETVLNKGGNLGDSAPPPSASAPSIRPLRVPVTHRERRRPPPLERSA